MMESNKEAGKEQAKKYSNSYKWKGTVAFAAILLLGNFMGVSTGAAGQGASWAVILGYGVVIVIITSLIFIFGGKSETLKAMWPPREKKIIKEEPQPDSSVTTELATDSSYRLGHTHFKQGLQPWGPEKFRTDEGRDRYLRGYESAEHESNLGGDNE